MVVFCWLLWVALGGLDGVVWGCLEGSGDDLPLSSHRFSGSLSRT